MYYTLIITYYYPKAICVPILSAIIKRIYLFSINKSTFLSTIDVKKTCSKIKSLLIFIIKSQVLI